MSHDIAVSSSEAGLRPYSTSTAIIGAGSQRRSTPSKSIIRAWARSRMNVLYSSPVALLVGVAREALADHLGDAGPHRDAVQSVRDLHGPFLVRDDEQLALLPQLLEEGNQPAQVDV